MSDLNKHLIAIAVASAKDHILWEINNTQNTWETPESEREYATIEADKKAATNAYIADGGLVTNRSFTGFHGGDLSHYDIDEAIVKKFGRDRVCADSESGGFFAYTDASVADELDAFLKDKFPGLEYGIHVDNDPRPLNGGSSWMAHREFLKKAGVTVDYNPIIPIPRKSDREIIEYITEARKNLLLTGIFSNEEVTEMLLEANAKAGVK